MPCMICQSGNERDFLAEVNIHLPSIKKSESAVGVFVFPKLLVCLDCGTSSFMTPAPQFAQLYTTHEPLA